MLEMMFRTDRLWGYKKKIPLPALGFLGRMKVVILKRITQLLEHQNPYTRCFLSHRSGEDIPIFPAKVRKLIFSTIINGVNMCSI